MRGPPPPSRRPPIGRGVGFAGPAAVRGALVFGPALLLAEEKPAQANTPTAMVCVPGSAATEEDVPRTSKCRSHVVWLYQNAVTTSATRKPTRRLLEKKINEVDSDTRKLGKPPQVRYDSDRCAMMKATRMPRTASK